MYCFLRKTYKLRELCGIKLQKYNMYSFDNQENM